MALGVLSFVELSYGYFFFMSEWAEGMEEADWCQTLCPFFLLLSFLYLYRASLTVPLGAVRARSLPPDHIFQHDLFSFSRLHKEKRVGYGRPPGVERGG